MRLNALLRFRFGAPVARVARDRNINANQVWTWRERHAQGLPVEVVKTETMLPVVVDVQPDRPSDFAPDVPVFLLLQLAALRFSMAILRFG
ncbi:hypothetical protein P3T40_004562 [Paraburkholderia sp. EB58]|jgi:hypothetical protein|uniref:hypothetical protein n=1 Tax=Paraburkholderia sp. EB58 TaxID=3035125 RepID=UPI003D1B520E